MSLSAAFTQHLETVLRQHTGAPVRILQSEPVSGGYINKTLWLQCDAGNFIIKINDAVKYPAMFAGEAAGLQLIAATNTVSTPRVITVGEYKGLNRHLTYLIMERIDTGPPTPRALQLLGQQLAAMHRHTAPQYGLKEDFISIFPLSNKFHDHWPAFFIEERLQPMVKRVYDNGGLDEPDLQRFDTLYKRLDELIPYEPPALVHGDCWNGNCLFSTQEIPYLIDPGAYYGHREVDISMTKMFGGLDHSFYDAYQEAYPLEKDWEQRLGLWHLYPLLVLNLFGPRYREQLVETLGRYV